jgi:hypothetical protein
VYLLAHGGEATGVQPEFLLLAVTLLILSITLFFQKSTKPIVSVVLAAVAFALIAGAFAFH